MVERATFQHGAREDAPAENGQGSRSLVPVASSALNDAPLSRLRPAASFLAHLIATAQQAPQTRARRQAEPGEASARYAATAARPRERRGSLVLPSL
jgi:hypothetical protein